MMRQGESSRKVAFGVCVAMGLLAAGPALAIPYTLSAPVPITGGEAGNPGVVGTILPEYDLSGVIAGGSLSDGTIDFLTQDVFVVRVELSAGSAAVDQFGIGAGSVPIIPNPFGAGTFVGDSGQAPDNVAVGTFTTLRGDFDFTGGSLTAGETSFRLFVTYEPEGSALADGVTANFMISSGTDFTVQGTLAEIPEPGAASLITLGLAAALAYRRARRQS